MQLFRSEAGVRDLRVFGSIPHTLTGSLSLSVQALILACRLPLTQSRHEIRREIKCGIDTGAGIVEAWRDLGEPVFRATRMLSLARQRANPITQPVVRLAVIIPRNIPCRVEADGNQREAGFLKPAAGAPDFLQVRVRGVSSGREFRSEIQLAAAVGKIY